MFAQPAAQSLYLGRVRFGLEPDLAGQVLRLRIGAEVVVEGLVLRDDHDEVLDRCGRAERPRRWKCGCCRPPVRGPIAVCRRPRRGADHCQRHEGDEDPPQLGVSSPHAGAQATAWRSSSAPATPSNSLMTSTAGQPGVTRRAPPRRQEPAIAPACPPRPRRPGSSRPRGERSPHRRR
jgi:hypothetical protein